MAFVAKLVGEGYERPSGDDELPIDINYSKVTEWLVDRKLMPQDWTRKLQAIQAKVAEAVVELPSGLLSQLGDIDGEDAPVDYFRAQLVLNHLAETAERGLLGSFKGSAGTWQRIVKAYEANMLHVAEAGLTMARNVDFEVPYFKKQAAKNQQLMTDLDRRAAESLKSAAAAEADFQKECAALGVAEAAVRSGGAALHGAVAALARELPTILEDAVQGIKNPVVQDAMRYYTDFTAATTPASQPAALLTLEEVYTGHTEAPTTPLISGDIGTSNEGAAAVAAVDHELTASAGISWDLDIGVGVGDSGGADQGGISWDFQTEDTGATTSSSDGGAAAAGISWDIDIDVGGGGEGGDAVAVLESGTGTAGADGEGDDVTNDSVEARRIAADSAYRARLLDDLYELRAFLVQRCGELAKGQSDGLLVDASSSAATAAAAVDSSAANAMKDAVDAALEALTAERVVLLASLANSAAHRQRLASKLARHAGQADKFRGTAADAEARKTQAQRQLMIDSGKLAAVVKHTVQAKTGVEKTLGAKMGRRINVQGEISTVVAQHAS